MHATRLEPVESDAEYFARRALAERIAAGRAGTLKARGVHLVLAETYGERARLLAAAPLRDGERERLMLGCAIAAGLAIDPHCTDTRAMHRKLAAQYRARLEGDRIGD